MSRETYEQDKALITAAARKVLNAVHRGGLPHGMDLRMGAIDLNLDRAWNEDSAVLAWIRTNFPGGTEDAPKYVSVNRGRYSRRITRTETVRVSVPLRDRTDDDGNGWLIPTLSYTYSRPHECTKFLGFAADGDGPAWCCAVRSCSKAITKTKARELGLLPPLQRKGKAA